MTKYSIEHSKSGRSKCKKCKEPLKKGELRIGVETEAGEQSGKDYSTTNWTHPKCFGLPRKLKQEGVTAESFVNDYLQDDTAATADNTDDPKSLDDPDTKAEIIADIEYTKRGGSAKKKRGDDDEPAKEGTVAWFKELRDSMLGEGEPAAKKLKLSEEDHQKIDIFGMYEKAKNAELHDILQWNHQLVSGTKDILMARVIDGQMRGRLGHCPMCVRGPVKLENESAKNAICTGYYDSDMGYHVSCSFKCPIEEAPREHPWYSEKPTEEEAAAMDAAKEALKSGNKAGESDDLVAQLEEKAEALEWSLDSKEGIQKATKNMVTLCEEAGVDLPTEVNIKMEVGKIVAGNKSLSAAEMVKLIAEQYGFAEANAEVAEKKHAAISAICHHPSNGPIVEILTQFSNVYFKEGNTNAGISYKKVAQAVSQIDFEITADNAKGLGKGKTKVDGIGKTSAERIHEFVTTEKIQKLEDKLKEAA